jgi:N-methylhydantoinase B
MANNPIETVEAEASVVVHHYGIRTDSGGPGQWRGGAGQTISFEVLRDGCQLLARGLERLRFPPWGSAGGRSSRITRIVLNMGTERERDLGKLDMVTVNSGDVVTALMSGAGGYGDPFVRDPERVLGDVARGIVSVDSALHDYGVVISNGLLDTGATDAARTARPPNSAPGFDFGSERAAWERVFDDTRSRALEKCLANLPAHERQRRRHAIFRALEPRLMIPATEQRFELATLFEDANAVGARLDALLAQSLD